MGPAITACSGDIDGDMHGLRLSLFFSFKEDRQRGPHPFLRLLDSCANPNSTLPFSVGPAC